MFLSSWLSEDKLGPDKSLREKLGMDIFESILLIKETTFLAYMTFWGSIYCKVLTVTWTLVCIENDKANAIAEGKKNSTCLSVCSLTGEWP